MLIGTESYEPSVKAHVFHVEPEHLRRPPAGQRERGDNRVESFGRPHTVPIAPDLPGGPRLYNACGFEEQRGICNL